MKIQYKVEDKVYLSNCYGSNPVEVVDVHNKGVTVRNKHGETFFLGCRQVEPTPPTVLKAKWIPQENQ